MRISPRNLVTSTTLAFTLALVLQAPWASAGKMSQNAAQAVDQGDSEEAAPATTPSALDDDFDRLDGTGTSGKTVQVIDWEGNMEIHVYPKGSLHGLALKLDKRDKNKPVMVIGYRFKDNPGSQLIRRNIVTMPMSEGFKVFKDPSEPEFDKIIISNNVLSGDLVSFKVEAEPKQLYPDGHPALGKPKNERKPAGRGATKTSEEAAKPRKAFDEEGRIKPFGMEE